MGYEEAVQRMIGRASDLEIGLVMTWDDDESMVWTLWSVGPNENMAADNRPIRTSAYTRSRRDFQKGGGFNDVVLPDDQRATLGFHAEEVLLLHWEILLNDVRAQRKNNDFYPKHVRITLSKSC